MTSAIRIVLYQPTLNSTAVPLVHAVLSSGKTTGMLFRLQPSEAGKVGQLAARAATRPGGSGLAHPGRPIHTHPATRSWSTTSWAWAR
jgi:hypothetical protein